VSSRLSHLLPPAGKHSLALRAGGRQTHVLFEKYAQVLLLETWEHASSPNKRDSADVTKSRASGLGDDPGTRLSQWGHGGILRGMQRRQATLGAESQRTNRAGVTDSRARPRGRGASQGTQEEAAHGTKTSARWASVRFPPFRRTESFKTLGWWQSMATATGKKQRFLRHCVPALGWARHILHSLAVWENDSAS
jgi:hypothetical protein